MNSRTFKLCTLAFSLGLGCSSSNLALAAESETQAKSETVGYYPTFTESDILMSADYDYVREIGGPLNGPDLDRKGATGGIWPYEISPQTGLSRFQRFVGPFDYITRPFTPGETLAVQGPTANSWLQMGGSFPFLTRTYQADRSTFADIIGLEAMQYSPLFFDVLSISLNAAYVEASGKGFEASGLDDGFISALSFDLRGGLVLTDRTSLIVAGQVYIVFSDDGDLQAYIDAGQLSGFANLNLQEQVGSWDLRFFDDLIPFSSRRLFFDETYSGNIQQSGHYWVGIPDSVESGGWWDSRNHYLLNTVGMTAGTYLGDSLRFLVGLSRMDTFLWDDFAEHSASEHLSAGLFYDGYDLWIAPSLTYDLGTTDFFENPQNTVMLNGVAPLSPNITINGGFGYSWGEFYKGTNWNAGIQQQVTERLRHSLSYYSGYQEVLVGDDFIGSRLDYGVSYQLGARAYLAGYTGWFEGTDDRPDSFNIGGSFNVALGDYTMVRFLVGYQDFDYNGIAGSGRNWIYNLTFSQRLAERLNAELAFEYNDNRAGQYKESLVMLRLTRNF